MNLMIRSATGRYRQANKAEVLEVAGQYLATTLQKRLGRLFQHPRETKEFLQEVLSPRDAEVFCVLFLDNRHRLIQFEEMFRGTIDGTSVYPREVVKRALELNSAAVIFAHNHPSGIAQPSQADELITSRLKEALAMVDISTLDHFVVGSHDVMSFAEAGLI